MDATEVVKTYHGVLLMQGYSRDEAEGSSVALGEVLSRRPEMVETLSNIMLRPAPFSWLADLPAGRRMPNEKRAALGFPQLPDVTQERYCTKCMTDKPLYAFSKARKSSDGLSSSCKSCDKERMDARKKVKRRISTRPRGSPYKGRKPTALQMTFNRPLPR